MKRKLTGGHSRIARALRQTALSAAVVVAFAAYATHERLTGGNAAVPGAPVPAAARATVTVPTVATVVPGTLLPAATVTPGAHAAPADPTIIPTPRAAPATATPQASGMYNDGVYTGDRRSAMWGMVQVAAIIRGGRLVWVEFVDYPQDRETSLQINLRAVPRLQSEAIQAQSAEVDMISGATLTSQAFYWSLFSALKKARR